MAQETLQLRLRSITHEAAGILSFELRSPADAPLPAFTAGAHVDLHLPQGTIRSYSLVNPQEERHRYLVAVNRDPSSRGGSRFMHDELRVGTILPVSLPRNNFRLSEDADLSIFVAGGIGVTPILCMIERLCSLGKPWVLHYCARSRQNAAFLERIQHLRSTGLGTVHLNFDQGNAANMLDIPAVAASAPAGAHLYCCGPVPMLDAFERACASMPPACVHVEYFAAREAPAAEGGFVVQLSRSGKIIPIARGMTILDALLEAGVNAQYSCMEGICASCETRVLEGVPDHKDLVLTKEEKESNKVMMICCSGSKTDKLVLDL